MMSRVLATVVACLAIISSASALYSTNGPVVLVNDNKAFKKEVMKHDGVVLVEFFAPWCGHCKNLAPHWVKAAKALKGTVKLVAVDATAESAKSLAGKYGVQGFPTIKVFGHDKRSPTDYQGARDATAIAQGAMSAVQKVLQKRLGLKSQGGGSGSAGDSGPGAGKNVVTLTTENFEKEVYGSKDMWLVEFYAPWCGHCKQLAPEWANAADSLKGSVKIGAVDATAEQALAQTFGVRGYPTIKVFPPSEGPKEKGSEEDYQGPRQARGIVDWAMAKLEEYGVEPSVDELLTQEMLEERCDSGDGKKICILAFLPDIRDSGKAGRNDYLQTVIDTVKKARGGSLFSFLWLSAGSQPKLEKTFGLTFGFPTLVAAALEKGAFAVHKGAFEVKKMNKFILGITTGKTRTQKIKGDMPKVVNTTPWDGEEPAAEEEEFSLDDIMGDDEL